jgi:hypothetical protein
VRSVHPSAGLLFQSRGGDESGPALQVGQWLPTVIAEFHRTLAPGPGLDQFGEGIDPPPAVAEVLRSWRI